MEYNFANLNEKLKSKVKSLKNVQYFDFFFSFSNIKILEIYDLIFIEKPLKTKIVEKLRFEFSSLEEILNMQWSNLDLPVSLLEEIYKRKENICDFVDFFKGKEEIKFLRLLVKYLLYFSLNKDLFFKYEQKAKNEIEYTEGMIELQKKNYHKCIFRGQSDFSWDIVPSLLRNLKPRGCNGLLIDIDSLFYLYNENYVSNSLISKYNKCFIDHQINKPLDLDYRFLAWMQHSIQYSPLVDFTFDYQIALTFAVNRSNPNNFLLTDSAIYILDLLGDDNKFVSENDVNNIISHMFIVNLKNKIVPGSTVNVEDFAGKSYSLDFSSYSDILYFLLPQYILIDIPSNDRMKVQKACFILFYNYVSVQNKMFLVMSNRVNLFKHIIEVKDKKDLLNWFEVKYPEYKSSYLMNPYRIFND